jgi:hypothetical protein
VNQLDYGLASRERGGEDSTAEDDECKEHHYDGGLRDSTNSRVDLDVLDVFMLKMGEIQKMEQRSMTTMGACMTT